MLRKLTATATSLIGMVAPSFADEMAIGTVLPAVAVQNQDDKTVSLREDGSKGWTLVYFYPKADTPGCTKQACSLRDSYEQLTKAGVTVFGVSMNSIAEQKAFKEKYKLPFTLLADKEGKVADAFGVPHVGGFTKRQAYLFHDGKLVWRDLTASTEEQAKDVLEAMKPNEPASE